LEEREQANVVWSKGVHLGERYNPEHKILLYQIEGFYVEVFYNPVSNAIKRLRSFSNTGQLRPYLEKIDLSGIMC
jgi:hypothetical protein